MDYRFDFEDVEHTADWALHIRGRDWPQLLENAARGMESLFVSDLDRVPTETERTIELETYDSESLLVEWLSELAFMAEMERLVFPKVKFTEVTPVRLVAKVWGSRVPELSKHIKAVTYHNLKIELTGEGFETTVVFDV